MKRILAYGLHLVVAALAVPWLTLMASGLAYGVFSPFLTSVKTPQQFYSDYLLFVVVVVGALLAYVVSDQVMAGPAIWVWIPFTAVFLLRLLYWRAAGSVLVGPGSLFEHFFTADCQIQNWREIGFGSGCSDKLFLTPLFIGGLSYSAGAAVHRVKQARWPKDAPVVSAAAASDSPQLVTTRFGAFLVLAFAASVVGSQFHSEMLARHSAWTWLGSGFLPARAVVIINIAFWAAVCWMGVALAFSRFRKDEKTLLASYAGVIMLIPVGALLPRIRGIAHVVQTLLSLAAFFAALVILLSFAKRDAKQV
ncbi:MAG: hypothetical protein ACLPLR_03175 [Terriglobales bacterium]